MSRSSRPLAGATASDGGWTLKLRWGKQAGFRAALAVQEVFAVPDAGSPP